MNKIPYSTVWYHVSRSLVQVMRGIVKEPALRIQADKYELLESLGCLLVRLPRHQTILEVLNVLPFALKDEWER